MMRRCLLSLPFLLLLACRGGDAPAEPAPAPVVEKAQPVEAAKAEAPKLAAPAAVAAVPPKPVVPPGHGAAKPAIEWEGPIEWLEWDAAREKAKAESKPICLVVYADWCPRCRELAPIFSTPEVAALAKNLIMVRQNNDARPDWLQQYVALGTYVPRVFFFSPDGTLREDIKSDHPRFPYFYTPHGVDVLKRSMQAAAAGG